MPIFESVCLFRLIADGNFDYPIKNEKRSESTGWNIITMTNSQGNQFKRLLATCLVLFNKLVLITIHYIQGVPKKMVPCLNYSDWFIIISIIEECGTIWYNTVQLVQWPTGPTPVPRTSTQTLCPNNNQVGNNIHYNSWIS